MQFLPGNLELSSNPFEKMVWIHLKKILRDVDGILGYKLPALGNKITDDIPSFILRSIEYGVVIIDVVHDKVIDIIEEGNYWIRKDHQDFPSRDLLISTYNRDIENRLSKSSRLFDYKRNMFRLQNLVHRILIFPENSLIEIQNLEKIHEEFSTDYIGNNNLENDLKVFFDEIKSKAIDEPGIDEIDSILEGTAIFNKQRRSILTDALTRNDLIKKSLVHTFKLDSTQRSVALQIPNGPQRIRGLAGTGKTIILSMKAALTYISNKDKDFNILFVFNTQSMYNSIIENIEKYTIEESSIAPDWSKLKVLHAWGGSRKEGLYSMLCHLYSIPTKTYWDAKGKGDMIQYIFSDLLSKVKNKLVPIYDMVLIDEAQDFPPAFFETIYHIAKEPKRIIWAYDEFQSLSELKIAEPSKFFGVKQDGSANIPDEMLEGEYEEGINKDYMLPHSYRNPRKVLMYAHGLGLGLYSNKAKVPMEDRISWEARGYKINSPKDKSKFEENDVVIVERPKEFSKNILETLIEESPRFKSDNIITYRHFDNINLELDNVIKWIRQLINRDNIEPEEIIVISLDKSSVESQFNYLRSQLLSSPDKPIYCISPGVVENADLFKEKGRITLTTPFRAKGNEANVIFVINSQRIINDRSLRERNALFVSITRSRGWCYISGNGLDSKVLEKEIALLENKYPLFEFTFPKRSDYLRRINIISNLDRSLSKTEKNIDEILKDDTSLALMLEKAKDDPELIKKFKEMLGKDED